MWLPLVADTPVLPLKRKLDAYDRSPISSVSPIWPTSPCPSSDSFSSDSFGSTPGGTVILDGRPSSSGIQDGRPCNASRGRVLIAEDNPTNQMVVRTMLKKLGFEFDMCANGREAVERFSNAQYSLILMDCHMPEMDGFAATIAIRKLERQNKGQTELHKEIPIVALTASALQPDRDHCMEVGMTDFLTKPIRTHEIKIALDKWLPVHLSLPN